LVAWINLILLIFNMIPVQPLDGGKLFHLMMLRIMGDEPAQGITGAVGLALSVVWIPAMIVAYYYEGWILFFIPSIMAHYRMMRGEPAY
jgi:Zn-dependent protease